MRSTTLRTIIKYNFSNPILLFVKYSNNKCLFENPEFKTVLNFNEYGRKNIATIVYDRSPIQERAPYIAANNLRLLLRLMGLRKIMDEMAETPYPSLKND